MQIICISFLSHKTGNNENVFQRSFVVFLFVYAVCVVAHALLVVSNGGATLWFMCGLVLAFCAHARKNYITITILVVHMGIEWFEWSHQKLMLRQVALNGIHAVMDFVFLSHELKVHVGRYRHAVSIVVACVLVSAFFFGQAHTCRVDSLEDIEPFILGGVLGCLLSHIYFHVKKE